MKGTKSMRRCCVLLLMLVSLVSCQVKRPDTVLSDAKMADVLYDYHIAKALGEELPYNESYKKVLYIESVFRKHGVTQAEFDSSMVWFSRNPEALTKVYSSVNERLKSSRDGINRLVALRENKVEVSQPGDSVDVWAWRRSYRLSGMPLDNKLTFVLSTDSNFQNRDTLCWNVDFSFDATTDTACLPLMALQLVCDRDRVSTVMRRVLASGTETLTLADTVGHLHEVRGFIYFPQEEPNGILRLGRISLMRYHATDSIPTDSVTAYADSLKESVQKFDSVAQEEIAVPSSSLEEKPVRSARPQRPRPVMNNAKEVKKPVSSPEPMKRRTLPLHSKEERP